MDLITALALLFLLITLLIGRPAARPSPVFVVLAAWTPAVLLSFLPIRFIHPAYQVLNAGVSPFTYFVMSLGLLAFALGTRAHGDLVRWRLLPPTPADATPRLPASLATLVVIFGCGLAVYSYALLHSGLLPNLLQHAPAGQIYASRLAFHIKSLSHLVLLLDLTAIVFFAKFMESRRLRFLVPVALSLVAYLLTLQKSRILFIGLSMVFVALVYRRSTGAPLLAGLRRKLIAGAAALGLALVLLLSNHVRGIGAARYTDLKSPLLEQVFIYSGAPALRNLSGTLEGAIASDAPSHGRILFRSFLWPYVDREALSPTLYLEGINNGTALLYYWHDFGVAGVALGCFLAGVITATAFRLARAGSAFGLMAGCIAFYAAIMSVFTDVFFEPTTVVLLFLATGIGLVLRLRWRLPFRAALRPPAPAPLDPRRSE